MKRAHRLCGEADIGEVLVSDKVAAMAGGRFRFVGGPSYRMKGDSSAHRSFSLQGAREMQMMTRGRWVARNDEISLVHEAIVRVVGGAGGVVSVVGRAGVGKSRFLQEIRKMARVAGLPLISANARVFRGDRPFDVLRAVVAHLIDVDRESNAQAVAEKIRDLMRYGVTQRDVEVIGAMFGVALQTLFPPNVGAMRGASARLLGGLASDGPVLIAIDDTQHIGTLEREIIGVAIEATSALPLLFVFAGRGALPSEFRPSHTQVELSPLGVGATVEVVAELLGVREVGPDLVHLVEKTGEGNPLYLDEIIRSLRKDGRIIIKDRRAELSTPLDGLELPHSIEALIAARVDALGPAGKGVLQVGAAIGMSFSPALVQEACGLEAFKELLEDLVERGILLWDSANEYNRCTFSSVLVWEVVHRSIIGVRLTEYHRMVAEAMERIHGAELDGHRMQMAGHCAGGGRLMDAANLTLDAGDRLRDRQLLAPALQCWEQGVGWIDRLRAQSHASRTCETRLRLRTGRGWRLLGEFQKAEINLQVAQDLAVDCSNLELEARATLMLGRLYRAMGRPVLAQASLESARSSAMDGVSSPSVEALALWRREVGVDALADLGTMALDAGSSERAREMLEAARVLAGDEDKLAAKALIALASCHIRAEEYQAGIALLVRARERTEEIGDRIVLGSIENNIGIAHHSAGRYQAALKHFRAALAIRQGIGYRMGAVINLHNIGDAHFRLNDPSRAWAAFRQSRDLAKGIDWGPGELMNEPFLAYLESTDDLKQACERLDRVAQQADAQGEHETRGAARWLLGRLRWDRGDVDGAEAVWAEGLKLAETLDSPQLARDIRASMAAAQEE
jgi:tetratricopeptide (TPR) repeat protein